MGNTTNSTSKVLSLSRSTSTAASTMNTVGKPGTHIKCRGTFYPRNETIKRFPIPDNKVSWNIELLGYEPVDYTAPSVVAQPVWADLPLEVFRHNRSKTPMWNKLDNKINRQSHMGPYDVIDFVPRNPVGRTGVKGRGCLGRWGPNHAADPIVTRWKRDADGKIARNASTGLQILQFICIQRSDSGEWAIPGGMVEAGERVSTTLKREFSEEAMNSLEATPATKQQIETNVSMLFQRGEEVYRGYVDDPRNTDNSWMETVAVNFHDEDGQSVGQFKLNAGDDAVGVKWMDINKELKLFASHAEFVEKVAERRKCNW